MNNQTDDSISSRIISEAADWLARMHSKNFSAAEKTAWEQWLQQSAEHQRVWKNAELLASQFGRIEPRLGMSVLDRPRGQTSRRRLLGSLAVLTLVPSAAWFGAQLLQMNRANFYHTATGERREIMLADRSLVTLNTATELNVKFDSAERLLEHSAGEIFVQTAPDKNSGLHRPFIVETKNGRMRALGTQFVVRQGDFGTRVAVLEGAVEVITSQSQAKVIVDAGQQVLFSARALGDITPVQSGIDTWRNGILYAQAMRLADFTMELARYRPGLLRCSPAVADLRVTGVFRVSDTDNVLRLLADTLPVQIESRTRYWVTINPK